MHPEQKRAAQLEEYISSLSPEARALLQKQYGNVGTEADAQARLIQSSLQTVNRRKGNRSGRGETPERSFYNSLSKYFLSGGVKLDYVGSLNRTNLRSIWTWISRDAAPLQVAELAALCDASADVEDAVHATKIAVSDYGHLMLERMNDDDLTAHRARIQLGGEENEIAIRRLLAVLDKEKMLNEVLALVPFLEREDSEAQSSTFFRAAIMLNEQLRAFIMLAAVRLLRNPIVLVHKTVANSSSNLEANIRAAGLGTVLDAVLADAAEQVAQIDSSRGVFADAELMCMRIARFVKNARALSAIDIDIRSPIAVHLGQLKSTITQKLQGPLEQLVQDIRTVVASPDDGPDQVDKDAVLRSLSGLQVLVMAHRYKDTLAMNKQCEKLWDASAVQIEAIANHSLDKYRKAGLGNDRIELERLDAAIEIALVRFDDEYPEILRRSRNVIWKKRNEPQK